MKRLVIHILSLVFLVGCSVKQNKNDCPCRLFLDFSKVDTNLVCFADLMLASDDGFSLKEELTLKDFRDGMEFSVPRTGIALAVWSGTEDDFAEKGIYIPVGEACPPLYFHLKFLDSECDALCDTVYMRKNYALMTVRMSNPNDGVQIRILGNVNGYKVNGIPSEGEFRCDLDTDGRISLPRQLDNSLLMEIQDDSGVFKRFPIGEYIAESGYDWNADDLEDIEIEVDIKFSSVTLTIEENKFIYEYTIVI